MCPPSGRHSPVQGLLHSAYLAMAANDFPQAVTILQQALQHSPASPLVSPTSQPCNPTGGPIPQSYGSGRLPFDEPYSSAARPLVSHTAMPLAQ